MKKIIFFIFYFFAKLAFSQVISTVVGDSSYAFSGDGGQANLAKIDAPQGIVFDSSGNLYFADRNNARIRKIAPSGIINTVAGNGTNGFGGDGGPGISAQLGAPFGIGIDASQNLYIADYNNNNIRKLNTAGIISTVAGSGTAGFTGDGGQAIVADLNQPISLCFDMAGNFYISDFANHRVRKVTNAGTISTFAGNGSFGFTGNGGPAVSAGISEPNGLAVDAAGNLFIADFQDNRILKINTSGIITNFAGTGAGGYSGDGGLATNAELYGPTDIVLDAGGNMYVSDFGNNCIRKINANGIITTIAGIGTSGFSGDGGLAISAKLNGPYSLAFNSSGDLYFSDEGNNRIRKITNVVGIFENN